MRYLILHQSLLGQVSLVSSQGNNNVRTGLPLQLLHPGLGSLKRLLHKHRTKVR